MGKHFLSYLLLVIVMASSCTQEEVVQQMASLSESKFVATFEQNDSRTYLENGKYLRWTANDELSIFMGKTLNMKFRFDGETGDNSGGFEDVSTPGFVTGNDLENPCHYAVYPYNKGTKITETGILTINLPSEQIYAENSFGLGNNTMVAVTSSLSDMNLAFKNICGYLKFKLYGDDVTVKSVTLQSNGEEKLSGSATLTAANDKNPSIAMSSTASNMITLDCGTGVKIGSTAETATEFWFVVPPTTFESGFTIIIKDVNDNEFTKSTSKKISIERNIIKPISAFEVEVQTDNIPYVTFTANAEQTFSISKAVETLEYSLNGKEWNTLGTTTVTFGGENGNLRLRGKSSIGTAIRVDDYATIKFGTDVTVACTGDIRTLIDYENYAITQTSNARFCSLFLDCTSLTQAPELPATTLASNCYDEMFWGCTSLTQAPELPATTLASLCYDDMFGHCTSLTQAPELPATTLTEACYQYMFWGCTSLTQAPELPATTLTGHCYNGMFSGCTSLTQAPELPATTLTEACYFNMFNGCTSLTQAPELPATTLTEACYNGMFSDCTSLTQAPELPATTLASRCYLNMFSYCTSLTQAPELPATTLTEACYNRMFFGCSNLNSITMLATNINTTGCLDYWVNGVSSIGTFTKSKEMTSLSEGHSGKPKGWIVIDK